MPTTEDPNRRRARLLVEAAMAEQQHSRAGLARLAKVDPGTLSDFLEGARWPKAPTQGRIEYALGWEPGTIAAVAAGEERAVGGRRDDQGTTSTADFLYQRPEGMTDDDWERVRDRAAAYLDGLIDAASRER